MHPTFTKIIRVHPTVSYNMHTKFELNQMHHLDARILLTICFHRLWCIKFFFWTLVKKTLNPTFTKINTIPPTVTYNIHTEFELNRMHRLDATMFTLIQIDHRKNNIKEFRRPQNVEICQNLKVEFFHDYNTFRTQHMFGK